MLKRILKAAGLIVGLSVSVLAGPVTPPAGNFIPNVGISTATPTINITSATIKTQLSLPFITPGQCTTTNSSGQLIGTTCGSGGGGGSGVVNNANMGIVPVYSVVGSSNVLSGSSSLQAFTSSAIVNGSIFSNSANGGTNVANLNYLNGTTSAGTYVVTSSPTQNTYGFYGIVSGVATNTVGGYFSAQGNNINNAISANASGGTTNNAISVTAGNENFQNLNGSQFVQTNGSDNLISYDLFNATPTFNGPVKFTSLLPSTFTALAVTNGLTLAGTGNFSFVNVDGKTYQVIGSSIVPVSGDLAVWGSSNTLLDGGVSGSALLGSNNTWTGTNTYNEEVLISSQIITSVNPGNIIFSNNGLSANSTAQVSIYKSDNATGPKLLTIGSSSQPDQVYFPNLASANFSRYGVISGGLNIGQTGTINEIQSGTDLLQLSNYYDGTGSMEFQSRGNGQDIYFTQVNGGEQGRFSNQKGFIVSSSETVKGAGGIGALVGTFTNSLTVAGQNVCQANGTNCPAGGAGASIQVTQGGVQITSPTSSMNYQTNQFSLAAVGSTSTIALNVSSVTLQGQNVIDLTSSLQSGATFFVSSGTVAGPFTTTGNTIIGNGGAQVFIPNFGNGSPGRFVSISTVIAGNPLAGTKIYPSDIPSGSTNYIQNGSSIQSGAVLNISSGTIATSYATTENIGTTLNIVNASGNGNGALTNPGSSGQNQLQISASNGVGINTSPTPGQDLVVPNLTVTGTCIGCGASGGGSSTTTVQLNGTTLSSQATNFNFIPASGVTITMSTPTTKNVSINIGADQSVVQSIAADQAGSDISLFPASNSGTSYTACPPTTLSVYTQSQRFIFVPDVVSGASPSLSICGIGPISLVKNTGATDVAIAAGDLSPGIPYLIVAASSPVAAFQVQPVFFSTQSASGGTSGINNTSSLQSGATFYVSSGTANTFYASSVTVYQGNLVINSDPNQAVSPFPSTGTITLNSPSQTTAAGSLNYNVQSGTILPNFSLVVSSGTVPNNGSLTMSLKGSGSVSGCNSGLTWGGVCLSQNGGTSVLNTNVSVPNSNSVTISSSIALNGNVSISSNVTVGGSVGTNGQVLTSGGPGTVPSWTTVSGSGASLSSTNTWTATQTFASSMSVSGNSVFASSVTVSSSIVVGGTIQVSTAGAFVPSGFSGSAGDVQIRSNLGTAGRLYFYNGAGAALAQLNAAQGGPVVLSNEQTTQAVNIQSNFNIGVSVQSTGHTLLAHGIEVGGSSSTFTTPVIFRSSMSVLAPNTGAYDVMFGTTTTAPNYSVAITTSGLFSVAASSTPTLSGCGTGPSIVGTNNAFTITPGSTAGGCTATFYPFPFKNTPTCVYSLETGSLTNAPTVTESATAWTITDTSLTSKIDVFCIGQNE